MLVLIVPGDCRGGADTKNHRMVQRQRHRFVTVLMRQETQTGMYTWDCSAGKKSLGNSDLKEVLYLQA